MDLDKLIEGKVVGYTSRCHAGKAMVVSVAVKRTGAWVTLLDKRRGKTVTVRPAQCVPVHRAPAPA